MNEQMKDNSMKTRSISNSLAAVVRRRLILASFCLLPCAFCLCARAQYALDWFSLDGGGGTSTGSVYAVSGAIGQPDAGLMQGGTFSLQGGFWGVLGTADLATPTLLITREAGQVSVSWTPLTLGFILEENTALSPSGWSPVSGGSTSPVTITITAGNRFFRLRK